MAMLACLALNSLRLRAEPDDLANLVLGAAEGKISKAEVAVFIQRHVRERRP